jgi:hypothetical protein
MSFKIVDNWLIVLHGDKAPGGEWYDMVAAVKKEFVGRGVDPATVRTIVYTEGGAPGPPERKAYSAIMGPSTTAVISGSPFVRTVINAFTLFSPKMKGFSPNKIVDAFLFLKATRPEQDMLWRELKALEAEVEGARLPPDFR